MKPEVQVEFEGKSGSVVQGKILGPWVEPVRGATVELQIFGGGEGRSHYRSKTHFIRLVALAHTERDAEIRGPVV